MTDSDYSTIYDHFRFAAGRDPLGQQAMAAANIIDGWNLGDTPLDLILRIIGESVTAANNRGIEVKSIKYCEYAVLAARDAHQKALQATEAQKVAAQACKRCGGSRKVPLPRKMGEPAQLESCPECQEERP